MNNVVQGEKYRFTVLTPYLIRMEYSEEGYFEDRKTQVVINRAFPEVSFRTIKKADSIEIITDKLHLIYDEKPFSKYGLSVEVLDGVGSVWHYGSRWGNLKGTTKTLDDIDGECELGDGIISKSGYAVLDDSGSIIQTEDGWVEPGRKNHTDIYFFGYGYNYITALNDYYILTGKTPMLPRYALGNWWSRYYPYTENEYKALMTRFEENRIPFSVSVIDMDWHLVDIPPEYGDGWTGYTWNKELFPDPKGFMKWLHSHGKKVTLNVHPALGCRPYEEAYEAMAEELGVKKGDTIAFDIADRKFTEAYFKHLHHPHEENGVDFWWIDWQQGAGSRVEGLDGLWMLNNYHYKDSCRNGKRGLIFSRYSGPGSHRYSVGFSGDTIITWDSLNFQPYFTATASNIGYGWWSNDIGGHMFGIRSEDMMLRWYQFGIFSPIMRLHSMNNIFVSKEPWKFSLETELLMKEVLRLRHRMVPYLYTMNHKAYSDNIPLLRPMYYYYPKEENAYEVKNQYYFGDNLIVMPITTPILKDYKLSMVTGWLPEGKYIDIFNHRIYDGGRMMNFYRGRKSIPVFAKVGSILPLIPEKDVMDIDRNPESLVINVYGGANGSFELYEDDNNSVNYQKGEFVKTKMNFDWENGEFIIYASQGKLDLIPEKRNYQIKFICIDENAVRAYINGEESKISFSFENNIVTVNVEDLKVTDELKIVFSDKLKLSENDKIGDIRDILEQAEMEYGTKQIIYDIICKEKDSGKIISELYALKIDSTLIEIITEALTA